MPTWKYSIVGLDPERSVLASGRDMPISFKEAVEVCRTIRGLKVEEAEKVLEDLIKMRRPIPFKRYRKKVGHRRMEGWDSGRYPVKAAKYILEVLRNLKANAEDKALDIDRLVIVHAAAQQGRKIKKYIPRAYGRSSPYFQQLVHIELAAVEELEEV